MPATPRSAPHFPNELYREIAIKLHQRADKDVLLSLSLVSNVWRHESQRVLFSSLGDDWNLESHPICLTLTHILFLESILAHPERLGPYVRLYAQYEMSSNPIAINASEQKRYRYATRLWELTSRALPAMINLKHLYIYATLEAPSMAREFLFACKFQLETLIWRCDEPSDQEMIDFLRSQRVIRHLEVGEFPDNHILPWSTRDMCPNLTSAACNMDSILELLQSRRDIVALRANMPTSDQHMLHLSSKLSSVLARIKYLSVWNHPTNPFIWPIAPTVSLLELQVWRTENLSLLSSQNFPNLRVLAFLDEYRGARDLEHFLHDFELCFRQLPRLETILIRTLDPEKPFGHHAKIHAKISLNRVNPDAVMEVGWMVSDCRHGLPWWTVYSDMML